jgi:YHS domain-containing protein
MKRKFGSRIGLGVAAAMVLLAGIAPGAGAVKNTGHEYNTLFAGLGAKGYDVVSYFTDGKPVPGSERYAFDYRGVSWRFASAEHRDLFAKSPAKYAPQYGGFCTWGVAQGKLFDVDPVNGWTIHEGKLYLNFNAELNGTFQGDPAGFIAKAEKNWPKLDQ